MFEIDKHGDKLEQKYANFIIEQLSGYNKIWSNFIGNDGTSHMPEINELGDDEKKKRVMFSQYHYTCLESLVCLYGINENRENICQVNLSNADGIFKYVNLMNAYIAFHAHAGRIRDLIDKMGLLYKLPNLGAKLNEYYKRRNNVLHTSKAPIGFMEGIVSILTPEGESPDPTKWYDDKLWSDHSNTSIEFINEYFEETFQEIVTITNNCLERLYSLKIAPIIKEHGIKLASTDESYYSPPVSASK